jgi:signal transduction histidine kinase
MHIFLVDKSDRVLYSNLDPECRNCLSTCTLASEVTHSCGVAGRRRRGVSTSEFGKAYVCTDDADLVASSKIFRRLLNLHAAMLGGYQDIRQQLEKEASRNARRLLHNVTSLNAHILQELYSLVPQEKLLGGASKQIDEIRKIVTAQTKTAAYAYLKVLKNATAMKTEFSVVDRLWSGNLEKLLQLRPHNIHRVVLNTASVFFLEFQEKGVKVDIDHSAGDFLTLIDYEAFSVALYHLLHNAVKYTSHNSTLTITFARTEAFVSTIIAMDSLHIYPHERTRIFDDEYSGELPRKLGKVGSGYGLGAARTIMRLHGGDIIVTAGHLEGGTGGGGYSKNAFELRLPLKPKAGLPPKFGKGA